MLNEALGMLMATQCRENERICKLFRRRPQERVRRDVRGVIGLFRGCGPLHGRSSAYADPEAKKNVRSNLAKSSLEVVAHTGPNSASKENGVRKPFQDGSSEAQVRPDPGDQA